MDTLTEREHHDSDLPCPSYCQYCAAENAMLDKDTLIASLRAEIKTLQEDVRVRAEILRQVAENLEPASYKLGETFDPEAAKAFHYELSICQLRAERLAGKKEE